MTANVLPKPVSNTGESADRSGVGPPRRSIGEISPDLLLPVVVLAGILAVGLPQAESVIGEVEPGSPAAAAGLEPGGRTDSPRTRTPAWTAAIASGTVDIPTASAPRCRSILTSAGVSYEGPLTAA